MEGAFSSTSLPLKFREEIVLVYHYARRKGIEKYKVCALLQIQVRIIELLRVRMSGTGRKPDRVAKLTSPNWCWTWDISYLGTDIPRIFWYLFVMLYKWSRKAVALRPATLTSEIGSNRSGFEGDRFLSPCGNGMGFQCRVKCLYVSYASVFLKAVNMKFTIGKLENKYFIIIATTIIFIINQTKLSGVICYYT
jgi:hypothetical protein